MGKNCKKCGQGVLEKEIMSFAIHSEGGNTLEPQLFEHKNCGEKLLKNPGQQKTRRNAKIVR